MAPPLPTLRLKVDRFDDFHVHGASAPEWMQRYQQISCGTMHSSLTELTVGSVHIFSKTLDQRVVQQGCLPAGKLCFAMLASASGPARLQGRELTNDRIFVLRSGEEFVLHRPAHMELLAVTVDERRFSGLLADQTDASGLQVVTRRTAIQVDPAESAAYRSLLVAMFLCGERATEYALPARSDLAMEGLIYTALLTLLRSASHEGKREKGLSAHVLVTEGQRMTMDRSDTPHTIEELCASPDQLTVGDAAARAGFSQLSHFAAEYKRLFAEVPSQTPRADRHRRAGAGSAFKMRVP
jgi:AraC family ethanolamine operon transcriptional activator